MRSRSLFEIKGFSPGPLGRRIAEELELRHRGKEHAIRGRDLAALLGATWGEVAAEIERLRRIWRLPIGSTRVRPYGYYWIENLDEAEETIRMMERSAFKMLTKVAIAKRTTLRQLIEAQLPLYENE